MKALLMAFFLLSANQTHASVYECVVAKFGAQMPEPIGTMLIDLEKDELKKVVINANKDIAACTGVTDGAGGKSTLLCLFADGESDIAIRRLGQNQFMGLKRSRRSGEIGALPVTFTTDGAETLGLIFPLIGKDIGYLISCSPQSSRNRRR